jgi:hypothetical protein
MLPMDEVNSIIPVFPIYCSMVREMWPLHDAGEQVIFDAF